MTCARCGGPLPPVAVLQRDRYCSTVCARIANEVPLPGPYGQEPKRTWGYVDAPYVPTTRLAAARALVSEEIRVRAGAVIVDELEHDRRTQDTARRKQAAVRREEARNRARAEMGLSDAVEGPPCACGCGDHASPRARYIRGHNHRRRRPEVGAEGPLCLCGCGGRARPGSRFIHKHNWSLPRAEQRRLRTQATTPSAATNPSQRRT
jgi:hypothetical protein